MPEEATNQEQVLKEYMATMPGRKFVEFTIREGDARILIDASSVVSIREEKGRTDPMTIINVEPKDYWYVLGTYEEVRAKLGI